DYFEKKLISVDHIHTDKNVVDLLAKPFDAGRFQYLVCKIFPLLGKLSTISVFLGFGLTFAGTSQYWGVLRILMISHILIPLVSKEHRFSPDSGFRQGLPSQILATVEGKLKTVSESSIRRNLKLNDEAGISSLPDAELFENLTLMGYNISPNQKFTFQKGQFSHQWKYIIHTIMQCLSPKSTGFNEFRSNIATALVCLATNRIYNFSKMIFDDMVRNVNNKVSKFLMYLRFLSKCLKMGQFGIVPLFPSMMVTMGEGSGTQTEPHHTPNPEATPSSQHELSSSSLPPVTTESLPTVIPSDNPPFKQYTRRTRIAQSLVLPPVVDEPASPLGDDSQARDHEISKLKAMVKLLEDKEGAGITQSGEDAPIKGQSLDEGEAAAEERSTERASDDTEEMVTVLTSLDAASILTSGVSTIVATSTTEAEYVAAASGCGQVPWIQNQLLDYGDYFEKKLISVDHIHTDKNVVDLLAKPFDAGRFQYLVCKIFPLLGKLSTISVFLGFGLTFAGTSQYWGVLRILMISHILIPLNTDFHPIVDFVKASHLRYALTINPTVYVSHIRQFWSTARIETTEEGTKILATVEGKLKTVSESSIRRNLKLNDEAGISSLPDAELFENLTLMGYNISPNQKFTFQKGQFSHQWKYIIHTIMQCLSPKSTGFNEFRSNIATALVCLATNRIYNFSKMIFDDMVRNVNNKVSKFLMYLRFLSKCLKMGQFGIVPLFPSMMVTMGEGSGTQTEPHHTPNPEATPSSQHELSSSSLPPVTTESLPTVIPSDNPPFKQYTRRTRIAQSLVLPPVVDEPASPLGDDSQARDHEISKLKAMVKLLEDKEGAGITQSGEDAPIKGQSLDEGEAAAEERSTERASDDTEEMVTVLTSLDAASILTSGVSYWHLTKKCRSLEDVQKVAYV
nr:hypothetical protein [Tanacetum cinerariifolium]